MLGLWRRLVCVCVIVSSATVSGCSAVGDSTAGAPGAGGGALWDACEQIPENAISTLDLDVDSKENGLGGVEVTGYNFCSWNGDWYTVGFMSSELTLEDFREHPNMTGFRDVTVSGTAALRYDRVADTDRGVEEFHCQVAFPFNGQTIRIDVSTNTTMILAARELQETGTISYGPERALYGNRLGELSAAGQWLPRDPCRVLEEIYGEVLQYLPQQ